MSESEGYVRNCYINYREGDDVIIRDGIACFDGYAIVPIEKVLKVGEVLSQAEVDRLALASEKSRAKRR
jgi:hypothetical protein